jgi:hypothetical protein
LNLLLGKIAEARKSEQPKGTNTERKPNTNDRFEARLKATSLTLDHDHEVTNEKSGKSPTSR